jgi:hypothetical protein
MSGAGAADQQRIAGGDKLGSFIGCYDTRRHVTPTRRERAAHRQAKTLPNPTDHPRWTNS